MILTPDGPESSYRALYEAGVEDGWTDRRATMAAIWNAALADGADRPCAEYFGRTLTYGALDAQANALAAWLAARGVARGERVAIILQNVPEFLAATLAAWKLAAVPVPINPAYRGQELGRILADAAPRAIIADARDIAGVRESLAGCTLDAALVWCDHGRDALAEQPAGVEGIASIVAADAVAPPTTTVSPDDLALLMYTSGTTGVPKGVMLTHNAIVANARLTSQWMAHTPDSLILAIAPLFHITGFVSHICGVIDSGSAVLLPYRMIPDVVVPLIRARRPTHTVGAITAFSAFMNYPGISPEDFASFERVYSGGAPIAPGLRDRIAERLGITVYPGYGMTETAAPTHYAPFGSVVPVDAASGALAIGVPTPGTDAMIAGDDDRPLGIGEPGEILVRGPQVMTGYRGRAEDSAATLAGGWMHTGDIAVRDAAGWFYIVDRKKDVIIASGFKVWPREVEDCLYLHPAVREAAVIGVPDDYRGETVKALVSLRAGTAADATEIVAHCRDRLAGYKVPRLVEIVDELPKTVTGKIQRNVLRDMEKKGASNERAV